MKRFDIRLRTRLPITAWSAVVVLLGAALSGCGTGQISQTANQQPAVNGAMITFNNVALRDIRIQAAQTGDFLRPGNTVDLVLVAVNQSPDITDKLVRITSDVGAVTVTGDPRLPASGLLLVGLPRRENRPGPEVVENAHVANATVALAKPITNGLTYNFTFEFEKAGKASVPVPISAGPEPPSRAQDDHAHLPAEHS